MLIGVPKEIKNKENRVAMTPDGVERLIKSGHRVCIERGAGLGSGFSDEQYEKAGGRLVNATEAWQTELVVKVKEPLPSEYGHLNGQMIFTFFHLAGVEKELTLQLLAKKVTAIAYETLESEQGRLPILAPMSAIAGNMATLMGGYYLAAFNGGRGVQLASVLNSGSGTVLIIGDGVAGQHAARVAAAMGAKVFMAGLDDCNFEAINASIQGDFNFVLSTPENIQRHIVAADLVVGAVLSRGLHAQKVVTEEMIKTMQSGSVVVDISIDQGGCCETSRPTTHSAPVFVKHNVIHYCVSNMPGAYPRTATLALTRVTISYVEALAMNTLSQMLMHSGFAKAIQTYDGYLRQKHIAKDLGMIKSFMPL
jgi:alanine dehydrogenase